MVRNYCDRSPPRLARSEKAAARDTQGHGIVLLSKVNFPSVHQFHLKPTCGIRGTALHIRMDK
jgi:hypothetical protein